MILAVTLNPAVDKVFVLTEEKFRTFNRSREVISSPGGGGINAAYSISALGASVIATGFLGGMNGRFIENELWKAKITTNFIHIEGETRTDYVILSKDNRFLAHITEKGPRILKDEIDELKTQYHRVLNESESVIIAGSLPLGVSAHIYKELIGQAKEREILTVLSSSNELIQEMNEVAPYCIHLEETKKRGYLFETVGDDDKKRLNTIEDLLNKGVQVVILDYGKSAFMVANKQRIYKVSAPANNLVNIVGMGNAFVGAFAHALGKERNLENAAKYGAAAAAVSGFQMDGKVRLASDVEEYIDKITLEEVEK